jgi:hypothetical protein
MAHTLKLSIYCFSIRDQRAKDHIIFKEFLNKHFILEGEIKYTVNKDELYRRFIQSFIDSFENKFVKNFDKTKAIGVNTYNNIFPKNLIDGMINGGLTGIEQDIYDPSNSSLVENTIDKDKVSALPYYFKIWMPFDSSLGILMVQSYTEMGVTSLFLDKFKQFFKLKEYSFDYERHVPKDYKERFVKKSTIKEIALLKTKLSKKARTELNSLFTDFEGLKIKITITGFKLDVDKFKEGMEKGRFVHSDLSSLEIGDESNYETVATYEDESGRESQARVSKNLDIFPTIVLNDNLKAAGKEFPDYIKIQNHTDSILEKIKVELDYSPADVD